MLKNIYSSKEKRERKQMAKNVVFCGRVVGVQMFTGARVKINI